MDPFAGVLARLGECEFRITVRANDELRVVAQVREGKLARFQLESRDTYVLGPKEKVAVAFDKILEVAIARELFAPGPRSSMSLGVALWHSGLPVDVLPAEGWLEVNLGEEAFAWPGL